MYTVGPDYAHAEARKSPALDGKVERDSEGKEVRYPVMLSAMEKLVARKVCLAFKVSVAVALCASSCRAPLPRVTASVRLHLPFAPPQQTVCGFDLLRANGHSYVCDVNGFSFVKNSMKYYDDCAKILGYRRLVFSSSSSSFLTPHIRTSNWFTTLVPSADETCLQEHCDARAGATVPDSLVHPHGGGGHPHRAHHVRNHVSHDDPIHPLLHGLLVN